MGAVFPVPLSSAERHGRRARRGGRAVRSPLDSVSGRAGLTATSFTSAAITTAVRYKGEPAPDATRRVVAGGDDERVPSWKGDGWRSPCRRAGARGSTSTRPRRPPTGAGGPRRVHWAPAVRPPAAVRRSSRRACGAKQLLAGAADLAHGVDGEHGAAGDGEHVAGLEEEILGGVTPRAGEKIEGDHHLVAGEEGVLEVGGGEAITEGGEEERSACAPPEERRPGPLHGVEHAGRLCPRHIVDTREAPRRERVAADERLHRPCGPRTPRRPARAGRPDHCRDRALLHPDDVGGAGAGFDDGDLAAGVAGGAARRGRGPGQAAAGREWVDARGLDLSRMKMLAPAAPYCLMVTLT